MSNTTPDVVTAYFVVEGFEDSVKKAAETLGLTLGSIVRNSEKNVVTVTVLAGEEPYDVHVTPEDSVHISLRIFHTLAHYNGVRFTPKPTKTHAQRVLSDDTELAALNARLTEIAVVGGFKSVHPHRTTDGKLVVWVDFEEVNGEKVRQSSRIDVPLACDDICSFVMAKLVINGIHN